ncbi:predicted protein [Lichtheimia corymbifera JMRC:FSU:9682]|uniref:Uncharacterized protein n=1 Tax=Lichtheimia corymbifera JMRC:FSU:9682 TaxID=1263082 RepID=A0A068S4S6_9FUNG|nr:predicted protein [Lichtheimia corymbifera JMRC:FSU:9682]
MEFEEVNNLIKVGHVHPGSLPSSSLPWHPAFGAVPHTATPGTAGNYHYTTTTTRSNSDVTNNGSSKRPYHHYHYHRRHGSRRQKPILGVTRLVNSVRRFKKPKEEEEEPWHITVSPMGTPSTRSINSSNNNAISTSSSFHPLTSLQEIKCQMQNFVVPADWHHTSINHTPNDTTGCQPLTGSGLINHLKNSIARFEYLIHIERQRITTCQSDIINYIDKLKQLDNDTHQIDTRLTLERLERTSAMYETLRSANNRIPRLEHLRDRQKRTASKVEGYIKSGNLDKRLRMLEMQTQTTRLEAIWARLRQWGPTMTLISLAMFIILLILVSS